MAQAADKGGHTKGVYWITWVISAITLHPGSFDNPDRNYLKCSFVVVLIAAKVFFFFFLSCCSPGVHAPYVGTAGCVVGVQQGFLALFLLHCVLTNWCILSRQICQCQPHPRSLLTLLTRAELDDTVHSTPLVNCSPPQINISGSRCVITGTSLLVWR